MSHGTRTSFRRCGAASLRRGFGLLALAALAARAAAQTAPLGLDDCVRAAQASPSGLAQARRQAEIAALGLAQARAAFRPGTRLGAAFTSNSSLAGAPEQPRYVALNGPREYLALLNAELELDTSGRLRAARERTSADQDLASAGIRIAERALRRGVAAAYYRVLLARRLAQVARDALAEARGFEARTRLLFGQGEAARADIAKAAAQAAFLEQAVTAADLDAKLANHALAAFWTSDVATPLRLLDPFDAPPQPPPDASAAPADAFLRRPELEALEAERRGLLADSRRARAERRPQLNLGLQYGIDSLRASLDDRGYAAFISLNVPIFDWRKSRHAARQLELQAGQREDERRSAERALSREYQDELSRLRSGYAQLASTRRQVELSEEDLRLSRIRYDGGEGPALDVVTAQNQLAQARTNHYTAVASYLESLVALEIAAGR